MPLMITRLLLSICFLTIAQAAIAQQSGAFPDPRSAPLFGAPVRYTKYGLVDFKTDKAGLIGQRVELSGLLIPFMDDTALLVAQAGDLQPISIDISAVPRYQRRKVFSCPATCSATVLGTVALVGALVGLRADVVTMTDQSQLME